NDDFYKKSNDGLYCEIAENEYSSACNSKDTITATVTCILQPTSKNLKTACGIRYTAQLQKLLLSRAYNSKIATEQRANNTINILDGSSLENNPFCYLAVGASIMPIAILLYPTNFEKKQQLLTYLDSYNCGKPTLQKIIYNDQIGKKFATLENLTKTIGIALLAFSLISLVVFVVMNCLTSYISTLQRTTEIGLLRALGARKLDVLNIFACEATICGLISGIFGVTLCQILNTILNVLLKSTLNIVTFDIFVLNPFHAVALTFASAVLTILSIAFPAIYASKKAPATCLNNY
ncbi:MAG: ABC transporter permease, partial [Clostridia bacterium]